MNTQRKRKAILAALLLATAFTVSSCYMNREDITGGSNLPLGGSDGIPFATLGVTATPTPTPTPTQAGVNQFQTPVNWDNLQPSNTPQQGYNGPTSPPVPTMTASTRTAAPQDDSVLRTGSAGDAVKQLQQKLKTLGYYTGSVDGSYGIGTANAVSDFQQVNGLKPVDGIAGKKTQEALYSYYAIPKSKSSSTSKSTATPQRNTATPRPTATPYFNSNTFLRLGSTGSAVKQLQARLISLGYLGGTADSNFGEATEAAVKAFQKRAGEWQDGVAGEKTLSKLYASNAPRASGMASTVGLSLKEGMDGDEVRALQKRLIELGYLKGAADGDFGSATKAAVTAFQQKNGLSPVDGIAGTATQNKLYASDVIKADGSGGAATATPSGGGTAYTTLREGDSGDAVKRLQQELKKLGYYSGSIDGVYGSGTVKAVTSFQAVNKLTADGVAGPATQQRLFGDKSSSNKIQGSLKLYDEGTNVRDVQYALYELGYFQDKVTGIYGDSTFAAVREFQMINDLTVDGVAGNATLNLLFSSAAKPAASISGNYVTLQRGSEGDDVVQLQATLVDLGYLDGSNVTGVFDDATYVALKSFQQYNGLTVDGIAGSQTQERLYSDAAVSNPLKH